MGTIELTQGYVAIVDDEDYEWLSQFKWYYKQGYAGRAVRIEGKKTIEFMHRCILDAPPEMYVDHVNGDGLDNRRANLRLADHAQNTWNSKQRKDSRLSYKGITRKRRGRYGARIQVDGKQIHLGYYNTPEAAARCYDYAAVHYYGEFARLNFPGDPLWPKERIQAAQYVNADKTSAYRGVSWYPRYQKWCAKIGISGRRHFLGYFDSEEAAARAYNEAAARLHGATAKAKSL